MALRSTIGSLTVGTTATQLTDTDFPVLHGIKLSTASTNAIYYGPSGVTTSTGFYIGSAAEISPLTFESLDDIYFIASASSPLTIEIVGQPGITIGVS